VMLMKLKWAQSSEQKFDYIEQPMNDMVK
jgi:hypothetical protein